MMQEPEIKRWTAERKAELIKQIYPGQPTISAVMGQSSCTQSLNEKLTAGSVAQ